MRSLSRLVGVAGFEPTSLPPKSGIAAGCINLILNHYPY